MNISYGLRYLIVTKKLTKKKVRYAERFNIMNKCRFNVNVHNIEREGAHWKIIVHSTSSPSPKTLICDKLIVATGMNSKQRIPELDLSKFDGFSFHSIDMASQYENMIASEVGHVTVVGGHKTALETVGLAARAGKTVEWLIREEGGGTPWMMQATNPDGSFALKPVMIRCFSKFGTSVYKSDQWLNRFFHSGQWALGTWFINWFWKMGTNRVLGDRFKSENGAKLKPKSPR
jgi:dimethylaniline monooxygenase (N-oxide forming)